jgi:glycosyltransferase involved in cell wall biosynthesis
VKKRFSIAMIAACPFPANHGSPASIREMSEALAARGHDVHVVTYPLRQEIPVNGVAIHRVAGASGNGRITVGPTAQKPMMDLRMAIELCRIVRRHGIDIIHAHNYEGALIGYVARVVTGRPLLYNAVNNMIDELPHYDFIRPRFLAVWLARLLDYWTPRTADFITVVSYELASFLADKGIKPEKVAVIPAGVNVDMFDSGDPDTVRRRHGIGRRPLIVYTGLLDAFQRVEYLLQAMKEVVARHGDAVLLIARNMVDESRDARFRAMCDELGISQNVVFTGEVALGELPSHLAAADVVVVPRPACPGFPVKLLNYMAAGKAIVSFAGSAKGLWHMYNGVVVEDHDVSAMADGIVRLLANPKYRDVLGRNARNSIARRFDWTSIAERIELIYSKMLSEGGRGDVAPLPEAAVSRIYKGYRMGWRERRKDASRQGWDRRAALSRIDFIERREIE